MIIPVILSGGSGSRIWPLSRKAYSKQFLSLNSDNSLLQQTATRVSNKSVFEKPLVVCGNDHHFLIDDQLEKINIEPLKLLLEPTARNTAPAIALAAFYAEKEGREKDCMLVLPSDHSIHDVEEFEKTIQTGEKVAAKGKIVTFGIVPSKPEIGYGYIHKSSEKIEGGFAVEAFVEKPNLTKAKEYVKSGEYFWNAGIFLFTVETFLKELKKHSPKIYKATQEAVEKGVVSDVFTPDEKLFSNNEDLSIDYALMEKSENVAVVPFAGHWNDIGSFAALWEELPHDKDGNAVQGDSLLLDTKGSYVFSESAVVTTAGVKDMVIVQTKDAVLVADKKHAQNVKDIVEKFKEIDREEAFFHKKVYRPWGSYEGIAAEEGFQVKTLIVNPGQVLSLQSHKHRNEHWVCVKGTVTVTRGSDVFDLKANQSTYIPVGEVHRLSNRTDTPAMVVEVQTGDYLGEDDIVRYDDIYGRAEENVQLPINMHSSHYYGPKKQLIPQSWIDYLKELPFSDILSFVKRRAVDVLDYFKWSTTGKKGAVPRLFVACKLKQIAKAKNLESFIETGTHYGELTSYVLNDFKEIQTIELTEELYSFCRNRFENDPHVTCIRGDSADHLKDALNGASFNGLVYLDAYYSGGVTGRGEVETPLKNEIDVILKSKFKGVVVVNNLRCMTGSNDYPKKQEVLEKIKKSGHVYHFEKDLLIWEMK